jgi:hypothetical protein
MKKIAYYMAWSFDGKEIAFVAKRRDNELRELAVVSASGSDDGFDVLEVASKLQNDIGWHPDGKRLIVAKRDGRSGRHQLHWVSRETPHAYERVPGQPTDADNRHPHYSRDGKYLYFGSQPAARQP